MTATELSNVRARLREVASDRTYLVVDNREMLAILDALDAAERERDEAQAKPGYDQGYHEGFEEGYDLGLRKAVQEKDRAP
jgi:flagellar biosynthesis/type III secretory pathway protein FliH